MYSDAEYSLWEFGKTTHIITCVSHYTITISITNATFNNNI